MMGVGDEYCFETVDMMFPDHPVNERFIARFTGCDVFHQ
jgi:hypothetical protein